MKQLAWSRARNVLCIRLDSLGGVLMCTPAMRALRQSRPGRMLTLLTSSRGAAAASYVPEIDAVIMHSAPWMNCAAVQGTQASLALVELLAARNFDAAVIFTSFSQSALPAAMLCHMAAIPLTLAHCRENPYQLLSHWVPDPEPDTLVRHEVRRQLDLVGSVGWRADHLRLSFTVQEAELSALRANLARLGIGPHEPFILMHPGASAAARRYPAARWTDVIRGVLERTGCQVVLTGDAADAALIDEIRAGCGAKVHTLAGMLRLGQLGAAIKLATVVVFSNTGPAHIAAALGTPLADLYALTNPQHTPWQVESRLLFHDVPCRFCYKSACPQGHQDCLAKVAPARVVEAVCSLMAVSLQA